MPTTRRFSRSREQAALTIDNSVIATIQPAVLAIRLFGSMEVRVEGVVVERLPSRRAMWLLAVLAIRNGRPIDRQLLAGLLWPDSSDAGSLHNLRQTLTRLRRALGPAGDLIETMSPRSIFLRSTHEVWVDSIEFDQALRESGRAASEHAVSLYGGPLLAGCDEPFAQEERDVRERAFIALGEQLAAHYLSDQEFEAAKDILRRIIAADPYRESACRSLMSLLVRTGETAAATDLYRNLRLNLRRDLNVEPDPETQDLYRTIRQGLSKQVDTSTARPKREDRLPSPLTTLLGRDSEVREVTSLLDRCRLVTLTGVGGVGKTRLAIAVAEATGENFLDGVRFVDLAPLQDPARVPPTIAACLDIPEQPGRSVVETLAERLRTLNFLIVLDNCEHLTQGVAPILEFLLSSCPGLHVLATSRQSIGVAGELVWRVPSLSTPKADSTAGLDRSEYLSSADSVRLFLDRASQAGGYAPILEVELEAVGSICRRLDGIPLAIELAAARTNVLSAVEIDVRLQKRFDLLVQASRTTARHQTLAAALEWSWDLLAEPERDMLMRLCVFRGGWTLESAEAVSDEGAPVLDLISSLVDRSMVVSTRRSEATRFTMLETIRQFATDRLRQTPECAATFDRHRDHFLELAALAKTTMGKPEEAGWFDRLESDHDNLRAAHDWSHESGQHENGLRVAVELARFWDTHGHLKEGRARVENSIHLAGANASPHLMANAGIHAGWMANLERDFDEAKGHFERAMLYFRESGHRGGMGKALNCLAVAAKNSGDVEGALRRLEEALEIFRDLGWAEHVSSVLANMAGMAIELKDNVVAREYLTQSIAAVSEREGRNRETLGQNLGNLSLVDFRQGRFEEAKAHAKEALALYLGAAVYVAVPEALVQAAVIETPFHEWERIARLLGAADGLAISLGIPVVETPGQERRTAEAEASLGLSPSGYRSAYERGRTMSMEEAIEYALGETVVTS